MAHLVKCWPCKHDDLSLILQNQKARHGAVYLPDLVRWKQAKNSKRHCFKKQPGEWDPRNDSQATMSSSVRVHTHKHTHTNIHTYTGTCTYTRIITPAACIHISTPQVYVCSLKMNNKKHKRSVGKNEL